MKSETARMSLSIRIITSVIIILMIYLFIYAVYDHISLIPAFIIFFISFFCWIYSPKSFEIKDNDLIIHFNGITKVYKSVKSISHFEQPVSYLGIRLFGNGGLFSGSGIFWTRKLGIFRAYVTSASYKDMILIETEKYKIIISPKDKDKFLNKE